MKQLIRPNDSGPSGGAITDSFVFTAASAIDPTTMRRVPEAVTVHDEVRVCLKRVEKTLAEDGLSLKDLTKLTAWVGEEAFRLDFAFAYRDLLAPGPYPSRALFAIGLPGDCRVQLDVIAARHPVNTRTTQLTAGLAGRETGFSAGVTLGDLVYADASALDHPGLERVSGTDSIGEETRVCLGRIRVTLEEAGYGLSDIVKANCYLTDDSYRQEFWQTFDEMLAPGPYPVRLTQVGGLAGDARVLIDIVAAR
ncbi:RidA family protein [Streptomyces fractus]|uniref:RidA family protein n=1 Tax=Streptomyces fractus TaxID=641806 RepID=UPI003CE9E3C5